MFSRKAFTLIELLVVIAIIAILAAILFPVFAQAKAAAKKTAAISNTKQIQLAAIQYRDDNDGTLMPRYNACGVGGAIEQPNSYTDVWPNVIQSYVKNEGVFLDPAAATTKYGGIWDDNPPLAPTKNGRGWISIGQNATIQGWYIAGGGTPRCPGTFRFLTETQLDGPAMTVEFMSSVSGATPSGYRGYLARNDALNIAGLSMSDRHNGGTVVGLMDGHAKWYKASALLGNPAAAYVCKDTSFYTGMWWLDRNAVKLKMNIQDPCINDPWNY